MKRGQGQPPSVLLPKAAFLQGPAASMPFLDRQTQLRKSQEQARKNDSERVSLISCLCCAETSDFLTYMVCEPGPGRWLFLPSYAHFTDEEAITSSDVVMPHPWHPRALAQGLGLPIAQEKGLIGAGSELRLEPLLEKSSYSRWERSYESQSKK